MYVELGSMSMDEAIQHLKKGGVPLVWAQKILFRYYQNELLPQLPGLMKNFQMIDFTTPGAIIRGVVVKELLDSNGKAFYDGFADVDLLDRLYGSEPAAQVWRSSDICGGYEAKFSRAVAGELVDRMRVKGEANLVCLGIGEAEEVPKIFQHLDASAKDKISIYGIDAFEPMLRASSWLSDEGYRYRAVLGDVRKLRELSKVPFEDAVIVFNANTKGNFPRCDRETIDQKIAKVMGKDSALYESLYYPPQSINDKWSLAIKYFRHPAIRVASDFDERERSYEHALRKAGFCFCVYNTYTNNVEVYTAKFSNGAYIFDPIFVSHRFTQEEVEASAKLSGLSLQLDRDAEFNMFVVRMKKYSQISV